MNLSSQLWNLPNVLTILRIVLTILFLQFLLSPQLSGKIAAALIFTLASLTDMWDGYIARKYQLITDFGKIMDPIADKFLILSAFFVFVKLEIMAFWMFLVIFIREVLITLLRLMAVKKGSVLPAERLGKYKTICQIITISFVLLFLICVEFPFIQSNNKVVVFWRGLNEALMWATVILTLVSGISFLKDKKLIHVR